jgi:uncharacterized glyoxalase superfamily protein PhnB
MPDQERSAGDTTPVRFREATPILRVADLDRSLAYYVDALGFDLQWRFDDFASVCRGDATLMLSEGSQGQPGTWVYLAVSDADALHDELRGRGATIRHPPRNFPWGSRELHVFDPDGHVLRLGADADPDEPLGDWLDEAGAAWTPRPDGSWRRAG